jgi:hypothetical protein
MMNENRLGLATQYTLTLATSLGAVVSVPLVFVASLAAATWAAGRRVRARAARTQRVRSPRCGDRTFVDRLDDGTPGATSVASAGQRGSPSLS